jgi:hypothetical protein
LLLVGTTDFRKDLERTNAREEIRIEFHLRRFLAVVTAGALVCPSLMAAEDGDNGKGNAERTSRRFV